MAFRVPGTLVYAMVDNRSMVTMRKLTVVWYVGDLLGDRRLKTLSQIRATPRLRWRRTKIKLPMSCACSQSTSYITPTDHVT